jgi:mannose/fructose/N-acetylgalactosamine-specific phosphotransferase system component IIC
MSARPNFLDKDLVMHALSVTALGLGAWALKAVGVDDGLIAVAASTTLGLASNRMASAADRNQEDRDWWADLLVNEHVAHGMATAIERVITREADNASFPDRKFAAQLASAAHQRWIELSKAGAPFIAELQDSSILAPLADYMDGQPAGSLEPDAWSAFLLSLFDDEQREDGMVQYVAKHLAGILHRALIPAFLDVVVRDLENKGPLYAKITLRFLGKIEGTTQRTERKVEHILWKLEQLAPSTRGLVSVRNLGIYGADAGLAAFSASLREFEEGLVHRPRLADQIEEALLATRFACVLGKGASGKTTLALVLAFTKTFGPERSYYVDLAEADDSLGSVEAYSAAMRAAGQQHGRDALVILDNIHFAEALTHKLYLAWREEGQPVRLLLQGRFTQLGADRLGRQSPLEEVKRTAFVLEVMREDFIGVLQRLVRRTNTNLSASAIPPTILDEWLEVFGGELIAFSSAARRKLPRIVRGHYQLTEADATEYMRDEYFENQDPKRRFGPAERKNIVAIAACAVWELPVPLEGLPHRDDSALGVSLKHGLVWQTTHGRFGQFARYRLCHPGLGKLLWEAAKPSKTRMDEACALAENSPHFGFILANRLKRVQAQPAEIKRVLDSAVGGGDAFERLIEHGMVALRSFFQQMKDYAVLLDTELDHRLASCTNLAASALATPPEHLVSFLSYAETATPKAWQALADALGDEKNVPALVGAALAAPLGALASFLSYAETAMPKAWQALADALGDEKNVPAFVSSALATSPQHLVSFLNYAHTAMPKAWQALADALADEKNIPAVVAAGLAAPLGALASFLSYAETAMPKVWHALADALADEENVPALVAAGLAAPLAALASFLSYAETAMPKVWQALDEVALDEKNIPALVAAALATPLGALSSFLSYAETAMPKAWQALADALADEKNVPALVAAALATPLGALASFLSYAETAMPKAWQALADALADEKNVPALVAAALAAPLGALSSFLSYAQPAMRKVWQALADALVDDKNRAALAAAALATPLEVLASFLSHAKTPMPKVWQALADVLVDQKNRAAFVAAALATPLGVLATFLSYAKTAMPNACQALADALVADKNRSALVAAALATRLGDLGTFLSYAKIAIPKVWQLLADALADAKNLSTLAAAALATPLGALASFLSYAKTSMPRVWQALADTLAEEKNRAALAAAALAMPLNDLASFLNYANSAMPKIRQALADILSNDKNRSALAASALATPLDHLASFLSYAETAMPKVWQALAETLADDRNRAALGAAALATPLGALASFLNYAKTAMPKVWQALAETLADDKNHAALAASALATPLDHLASFLSYAKTPMPEVWQALADALADDKNRSALAVAVLDTEFDHLKGFMSSITATLPDLAKALNLELAKVFDTSGIEHPRLRSLLSDPRAFNEAERVLSGCSCRELAEALACRLIQAADSSVWHVRGIHLKEVTTILRLGHASDESAVRRFLGEVATPDWLTTQYEILPPQLVAIALQVLWAYTPRYVRDHFLGRFPMQRAEACIRFLHKASIPFPAVPNLELLGASSLFKLNICGTTRQWPSQDSLDEIVRHVSIGLNKTSLNSHQILFLAGLSEMVRCRSDTIRFVPEIGERLLTLLRATVGVTARHQVLNGWLLNWLERCRNQGWRLVQNIYPAPEPYRLRCQEKGE